MNYNSSFKDRKIEKTDFNKVMTYMNNIREEKLDFNNLICKLEEIGDVILIGGAIRDIILKETEPRDLDLIIDGDSRDIKFIEGYCNNFKKNRFGGYKVYLDNMEIDIWSINDHWAFKENILKKSVDNIKYSTFLNFDALFINLTKEIGDTQFFNEAMKSSCLKFTLPKKHLYKNPTIATNVVRMFVIQEQWKLDFSSEVKEYIYRFIAKNDNSIDMLWRAQINHYCNNIMFTKKDLEEKVSKYK